MTNASAPATGKPAAGLTWAQYVGDLVTEHGSLAALALKVSMLNEAAGDAESIERGLRRLRLREHREGGQMGLRLLQAFGIPKVVEQRAKWMGVYHSRFTDLPVSLCFDQLRVWDRPPVAESAARIWIQLGFVTAFLRLGDFENAEAHLRQVHLAGRAPVAARIETSLLEAFVARQPSQALARKRLLAAVDPLLANPELDDMEQLYLTTRWLDQCAYDALHPSQGKPDFASAKACYQKMPTGDVPHFVVCKRESGLAYVGWKLGDKTAAAAHARAALQEAGDGGLLRLRVSYLGLLARILGDGDEGRQALARAVRAAKGLEDEALLGRLQGDAKPKAAAR
jgi:hypothetical protein